MTEEYTVDFKMVNGIPGVIVTINNKVTYVLSFAFEDEKISNIYMMVNPEKLMHLNVKIAHFFRNAFSNISRGTSFSPATSNLISRLLHKYV